MPSRATGDSTESPTHQSTSRRLDTIEEKLCRLEGMVVHNVDLFNVQLEQIGQTLAAVRNLAHRSTVSEEASLLLLPHSKSDLSFRVVTHISRGAQGTRIVTDISWPDMWSVRMFVTAMLRTLDQTGLVTGDCRCWCEVWRPDEFGDIIDSAYLQRAESTVVVEWESDLLDGR